MQTAYVMHENRKMVHKWCTKSESFQYTENEWLIVHHLNERAEGIGASALAIPGAAPPAAVPGR
jgi:hypothetical protein